jgi:2-keto-4-pentenoate hydratase/2-oxohepta-3-ene-1,7-dioic acid hydratase in catechol pathway
MFRQLQFTDGTSLRAGTLFCVASNYAKHANEMGSKISAAAPSIFIKPPQSIIGNGESIVLPHISENVHHEVELVVAIGKECRNIQPEDAVSYIAGYAAGIDVTMRDIQAKAKKEGKPWSVAKGFYTSAPLSEFVPAARFGDSIPDFNLLLSVNGQERQSDTTASMERNVASLITYLSEIFTLLPGDLIFTGTPHGVGKIDAGDIVHAELSDFVSIDVNVK